MLHDPRPDARRIGLAEALDLVRGRVAEIADRQINHLLENHPNRNRAMDRMAADIAADAESEEEDPERWDGMS